MILQQFLEEYDGILDKIIIDFKPISPKDGDLFGEHNPLKVAQALEKAGVLGLSVVTESQHFGGSLELLGGITAAVSLPVLRKDFIESEVDLWETREWGAKGVLLICATIPDGELGFLHGEALRLGLVPVVEVHNHAEAELARSVGAKVIGINNRDITVLEKDSGTVATTRELIGCKPDGAFVISESGITCRADALDALEAGADAVLIGTAFWLPNYCNCC
jgi:indole-3-glycerol phosphate synthase